MTTQNNYSNIFNRYIFAKKTTLHIKLSKAVGNRLSKTSMYFMLLIAFAISDIQINSVFAQENTWKDYVKSALNSHPNLKQVSALKDASDYMLITSYLQFLPDFDLETKIGWYAKRGDQAPAGGMPSAPNILDFKAILSLNLLNGGRDFNNVFINKISNNVSNINYNRNYIQTLAEILRTYNNYWHSRQRLNIARQRSSTSKKKLDAVSSLVRQRKVNSAELWKAEIASQLDEERGLIEAANLEVAKAEFIRVFDRNPPSKIERIVLPTSLLPTSTDQLLANIKNNWSYLIATNNKKIAKHNYFTSYSAYSPIVDFNYELGFENHRENALTKIANFTDEYHEISFDLTWKVSNFYKETTNILASKSEYLAAQYRNEIENKDIVKEISINFSKYQLSEKKSRLLEAIVANNSKILAAQKKLSSQGSGDALSVINVELEYLKLLDRSLIANYERDNAVVSLMVDFQILTPRNLQL